MTNKKAEKNVALKNQMELWLFCAIIGAAAGSKLTVFNPEQVSSAV